MNIDALREKINAARGTFDYRLEKILLQLGEDICAAFTLYLRQTSSRGTPFFHSCSTASFCSAGH
jgi:hypothetical protein